MADIKSKRVSKADWLEKALEVLGTNGMEGVRVEGLARQLGVAKSGFYWHFKDRDDLLRQLLDHWTHEVTGVITTNSNMLALKPKSRLIKTAEMILDFDLTKYEIAFRQWALHDEGAAQAVKKTDQLRLDFIREAFSELGFRGVDLETRTMLFVCYHSMESTMFKEISHKQRRDQIRKRIDVLTQK